MDFINISKEEEPEKASQKKKRGSHRELLSTLLILISAPIIAFILTIFVFQSYEVDGPSMQATLQDNDRLIVNKLGKTWNKITGEQYLPDRYSIVVFSQSGSSSANGQERQLIKRVIGLPGDRVVIKDGSVTIYNDQHVEGFFPDKEGPHSNTIKKTTGNLDETIEKGELFVMGDNRDNSQDSRVFGAIGSDDIIGRLSIRIFPLDTVKRF